MTTLSSQIACTDCPMPEGEHTWACQINWTDLLTPSQPLISLTDDEDESRCRYCGGTPIEQTRYDAALCDRCYDESLASDEADDAYDRWRDAQMGA